MGGLPDLLALYYKVSRGGIREAQRYSDSSDDGAFIRGRDILGYVNLCRLGFNFQTSLLAIVGDCCCA